MKNLDLNEYDEKILKLKAKKCLQCSALTDTDDTEELFCSKCGAPVVNRCSNYECDELLKEDAKFCKYCGSTSIFYNYGLLIDNPPKKLEDTDDLPF